MAPWTVVFAKILADHQEAYIKQRGDDKARAQILRDCRKEILDASQDQPSIALPDHLRMVSTEYIVIYFVFS